MSKWLIRKVSGSRGRMKITGDYSDTRNCKTGEIDNLPKRESMQNKNVSKKLLDTTLVKRWLNSKVGSDFDEIYSEFLTRIQPKYLDEYRDCIFWYVEKKENIEILNNGEIWGKNEGVPVKLPYSVQGKFYVNPETNKLARL